MNSIVNLMTKYDHRQHELSDWLLELEQRFQLGQVETDRAKITWCQLLIGATGSSILTRLEDGATLEAAKETLLFQLGAGSVRDEAWASLKQLTRGSKEILELASEAEEAAERDAVDAFLSALDRPLAAEVRKIGHTNMEGVVSDARRIEKILQEQPTSGVDSLMESMNRQIQILRKDLIKTHENLAAQPMAAPVAAALVVPPSQAVAAAHPPPASFAPPQRAHPAASRLPPMATAQAPQYLQDCPPHFYRNEEPPYFRGPRRQDRRPMRCFLCDEEGHFAYRCPARTLLQRLLRQQTQEQTRRPPQGPILELPAANDRSSASSVRLNLTEGSPGAKGAPAKCAVALPISGQLCIEGIPVLGLVDTGASVTCLGFAIWWRYRAQWGALKPFESTVHGAHGKPLNIAGRTEHLDIQWGEARDRASFIVIVGLESPPCLIGMDIMRPLRVHIDVTKGTATPAQPDPRTIHLNAAQTQQQLKRPPTQMTSPPPLPKEDPASGASLPTPRTAVLPSPLPQRQAKPLAEDRSTALPSPANLPPAPAESCPAPPNPIAPSDLAHLHTASCARLLQTADIPPETARLVRCHNPWPSEHVLFCPDGALPAFVTGIPALSSGPELWYAVHNHRPEPLQLHAGQSIGVLEVVHLAEAPATASPSSQHPTKPCQPPLPECLSPLQ